MGLRSVRVRRKVVGLPCLARERMNWAWLLLVGPSSNLYVGVLAFVRGTYYVHTRICWASGPWDQVTHAFHAGFLSD